MENKVTISLKEYDQLRDFKNAIESGEVFNYQIHHNQEVCMGHGGLDRTWSEWFVSTKDDAVKSLIAVNIELQNKIDSQEEIIVMRECTIREKENLNKELARLWNDRMESWKIADFKRYRRIHQ
jgi:hypothetical protein